jgi:hypothetical protein
MVTVQSLGKDFKRWGWLLQAGLFTHQIKLLTLVVNNVDHSLLAKLLLFSKLKLLYFFATNSNED